MNEREVSAAELLISANSERCLLAIDTAIGTSVACGTGGRIHEVSSDDPRGHTEHIGVLIARALELAKCEPEQVTDVAVGIGPGPFTGLRIGVAAAHAFALGRDLPLRSLQSHEAVALEVLERGAAHGVRIVQDAKRRELFVSEYSTLDWRGVPVRERGPELLTRENAVETAQDVWPERIPAARLIQLAARRLASDGVRPGDPGFEDDAPLYLRLPDVYAPSAPKRVLP